MVRADELGWQGLENGVQPRCRLGGGAQTDTAALGPKLSTAAPNRRQPVDLATAERYACQFGQSSPLCRLFSHWSGWRFERSSVPPWRQA